MEVMKLDVVSYQIIQGVEGNIPWLGHTYQIDMDPTGLSFFFLRRDELQLVGCMVITSYLGP